MNANIFYSQTQPKITNDRLWKNRVLVILGLVNLGLIAFDISYIPWRRYYFWYVPFITKIYDPIKGIEPNQKTETYINKVKELKLAIANSGLNSQTTQTLFKELQVSSQQMLDSDPFSVAQRTGMLDRIRNRMRYHMNEQSAKTAFAKFWDARHFEAKSWQSEIGFYESRIQPLVISNYFRNTDGDDEFINFFWLIDLGFITIFAADILARIYSIRRRNPEMTWLAAARSRWYDIFLLLPFWRWLRIISITIRLHESRLIDLSPIQKEIDRYLVRSLAKTVTREVVIQILNQIQNQVRETDIAAIVKERFQTEYVDINDVNEVKAISRIIYNISVSEVLPKIQPEIQSLVQYAIQKVMWQFPPYQTLTQIPGIGELSTQLNNKIIQETSGNAYQIILEALKDPQGIKLSEDLIDTLTLAISEELQKKYTWQKLQRLLGDAIEEIKINYVEEMTELEIKKLK
jgi:hypothetical protein